MKSSWHVTRWHVTAGDMSPFTCHQWWHVTKLHTLITQSILIQIENPFKLKLSVIPSDDFLRENPENWEKVCFSFLWHVTRLHTLITQSILIQIEYPFEFKLSVIPSDDFLRKNPENWEKICFSFLCTSAPDCRLSDFLIMHDFVSKNLSGFSTTGFWGGSFGSGGAKVTQNKRITRDFKSP